MWAVPPVAPECHFELSLPRLKRQVVFETFHAFRAVGGDNQEFPSAADAGLCFKPDETALSFVKPHHVEALSTSPIGTRVIFFNPANAGRPFTGRPRRAVKARPAKPVSGAAPDLRDIRRASESVY